jgi:protocatechuate 3,4-dioxygenase beta subunit
MTRLLAVLAISLATSARALDVSGYVYSGDGTPLEGLRVEAFVPVVKTSLAKTVTAKDGGFVLGGLPESVIELDVDGRASQLVLAGDSGITVTLEEPPVGSVVPMPKDRPPAPRAAAPRVRGEGVISGVARVNGKPMAGIPVIVQGLADRAIEPVTVVTNAKGEYSAMGLEAVRYAVVVDDRLMPRIRSPHNTQPYREGAEPFIADLRKTAAATKDFALTAAPMIRGRVVDAEGKPVARARVHMTVARQAFADGVIHAPARTAPDGRYAFPALELGDEPVVVSVSAPLHSTIRSKPFTLGTADREVNITIPKLEAVTVRVTDRAGKPVVARVAFVPSADLTGPEMLEMFAQRAPRTNDAGELALQLAPDAYEFFVVATGFQTGAVTKRIATAGNVDVRLERAAIIRGRVHRNDRGVPNVYVNVMTSRGRRPHATATDEDGRFEIDGLAPGPYRITLHQSETMVDRTMDVEAPADLDIALPATGTLTARVLDAATGRPVREFVYSVEPLSPEPRTRGGQGLHRGEQSENGTFTVSVPVGTYRVSAGAQGYMPSDVLEVRVTEEEPARIDIPLGRGVTVTGRVTDEAGVPLAEADVMVMGDDMRAGRRTVPRVGPGHAKSAADGTFTITGIEPGEAQLNVRLTGYVPFRKTLQAEGTINVDVQLGRGLSISGLVTRGGKPLEGAQVNASTSAIGGEHQSASTGEDGRFLLSGLVPARHTISAYFEDQHAEVRDVDPAKQKEVRIALDPKPRGIIFGTVTGIPSTLGTYMRKVVMVQSSDGGSEAQIDELGNYRIENAPIGSGSVAAYVESSSRNARSSVRKQVEVIAGQPLRVDLEMSGNVRVSGRVTHEGKGLAGAHVGFSSDDGTMASATTREDGGYEVALPAPGRFHIFARAEQLFDRHFSTVRDIRGGETVDIDLREQVVEGTVVDAGTRQPLANALVTITPLTATTSISAEVPTDANGRFRIVSAASGAQRLVATAPGYAHRVMPVSSAVTHYAFELEPASELRVRVLDAQSGSPLDAHLVVHEQDGTFIPGRMRRSTDGTTFLFSLAPGKYKLRAIVQGYAPRTIDVTAPGTVEVRME